MGDDRVLRYRSTRPAPPGLRELDSGPSAQLPIPPAGEPELYVRLLISDRRRTGLGIGAALLAHAERNGFTPTDRFLSERWPGQVLAKRIA
ncbi:hypothetical protein KY5_7776 [Streptomyces formicae]|uniref:N-acetyltransferase domain-containing protein n=1 Tax=Streptomyces formicae TaxID=1616117 RepID=A0A291QMS8_9ACTN|nr:hypothetical protein KY5_7776 [Streptomyces formicae]